MKPLTARQKQVLGSLSRRVYNLLASRGHVQELYDDWRHTFTADVTGRASWRALNQSHYVPLVNALRGILGLEPMADNTPADERASLAWTIKDRAAFWELNLAYVRAIVADKFHRPQAREAADWDALLSPLDGRQLKQLVFTIEARGRKRTAKSAAKHEVPAPVEVHTSRATMPPPRLAEVRGDVMLEQDEKPRRRARKGKEQACAR